MLTAPTVPPTVGANSFIAILYSHQKQKHRARVLKIFFEYDTEYTFKIYPHIGGSSGVHGTQKELPVPSYAREAHQTLQAEQQDDLL